MYLSFVAPDGEMLFADLVHHNKVDYDFFDKKVKQDRLPLYELQLSRKTTFETLLSFAAKKKKKNPKKGRLIVNGAKISGPKLFQTFEDVNLATGTLVHAEFINESNEWPSELKPAVASLTQLAKPQQLKKTSGLVNLGNTCYLNSALQIVANISQIYEYFVVN